jgi:DnaD/phage-associated family protein
MKKKFLISGAFPEPEWTQVPNKFFDMLPGMEASEALTTLVLIRETYGYHRPTCKMSIAKIAAAAGISVGSVKTGAEMAEERGTFRRSNPNEKTSAEWELVTGSTITPTTIDGWVGQPLTHPSPTIDPQLGVKESIKKEKESTTAEFHDHKVKSNTFAIYEQNIGALTPLLSDELAEVEKEDTQGWFEDAVKEALGKNVRNLKYIKAILARWRVEGRGDNRKKVESETAPTYKVYDPSSEPVKNYVPAPENLRRSHAAE